jgi:hypothetical protein
MKKRKKRFVRVLDVATIDTYLARAAETAREVREQLAPCFTVPASLHGVKIRG